MDTHDQSPLRTAIDLIGGTSAVALEFGISPGAVSQWLQNGIAPGPRCKRLEELTKGRVTVYQLNPEVFGTGPRRRYPKAGRP